ncbi:MAG: hypothetical protein ACI4RA_05655 [Kiritimatiellia bacterium]
MARRAASPLLALVALLACGAWGIEAEHARRGGERLLSNWHLGPFFEYRRAEPGDATFWAVRPFYSQVRDPATRTTARDGLWPLVTFRDHADASWWSAFLLFHGDARATDSSWSFALYPFWFSGADRSGAGYWGFFPFYGHHPHTLLVDDFSYALWPIWHTYEVKGVRSHAVCWPFVTWRDSPRAGVGVWPLYGQARLRESEHRYLLWPLVTWAAYDEDRDTSGAGWSWWMLPFYGEVRRARESQTMVLPPFFSYTETDSARRWRLPWPFIDLESSATRDRISIWPIWEQLRGYSYGRRQVEERTWRFGWKLVESTTLETDRTRETRFSLFPFFTWERRWTKSGRSAESCVLSASYLRVWPFWSAETEGGRTRRRTLELSPIRHSEGIERNWAPFWSLWEMDERPDGRTRHSLLWNFIAW